MNGWIGVTDNEWFAFLARVPGSPGEASESLTSHRILCQSNPIGDSRSDES